MAGGFFRPYGDRLEAKSESDLRELLGEVDYRVPLRTEGRRTEDDERYSIVHYLRTLERNGLLEFPLCIGKAVPPAPDFIMEMASSGPVGLEVTQAGSSRSQRAATELEKAPPGSALEEGVIREPGEPLRGRGYVGDEPERLWTDELLARVRTKTEEQLQKYPPLSSYQLLIYDNTELVAVTGWTVTELPERLARAIQEWLAREPATDRRFDRISVLRDRVLMYDVGGRSYLLPVPPSSSLPPLLPLERLGVSEQSLQQFCRRHRIGKMGFFGSVAESGGRFGPHSDVDVLVEFEPEVRIGLIGLAGIELELSQLLERQVDLRTVPDLSRYFRDEVIRNGTEFAYARIAD